MIAGYIGTADLTSHTASGAPSSAAVAAAGPWPAVGCCALFLLFLEATLGAGDDVIEFCDMLSLMAEDAASFE